MANIRQVVFDLLANDPVLNGLGITADSIFNANDVDTIRVRPFMITAWANTAPGMDRVRQRSLRVWVHDEPSDYRRIDDVLERVCELLTNQYGVITGDNGRSVLQIEWEGDSDDLSDDVQRTITRNSDYNVVGSAV